MFVEEVKNQVCNSCRATYPARWISGEGHDTDSSEGLCQQCRQERALKHNMLVRRITPGKPGELRNPFRDYPAEIKPQRCGDCGTDYEAVWYEVAEGKWIDTSVQRCEPCRVVYRRAERERKEREREESERKSYLESLPVRRELFRSKLSRIPSRYQGVRFGSLNLDVPGNIRKLNEMCLKYANEYPFGKYQSLYIGSETWGNGKTTLLCSMLHRILDRWEGSPRNCPVYFITEPEIYERIQATFSYSPEEKTYKPTEEDIMRHLVSVPLLAIDDVGKQERSDMKFVQRTLFSIINGRYNAMLPVLITANKSMGQLEEYLGGNNADMASFDRLKEMCGKGNFLILRGESQRGK